MNTYTYFDYTKNREVIFTCEATTILEADKQLLTMKGIDASKSKNIGCEPQEASLHEVPKMR